MTPDALAIAGAWAATGVGLGMWVWGFAFERHLVRRQRLLDCGMVLVFSAILLRIVAQERPLGVFDWAMVILGPVFIGLSFWRLCRTCEPRA